MNSEDMKNLERRLIERSKLLDKKEEELNEKERFIQQTMGDVEKKNLRKRLKAKTEEIMMLKKKLHPYAKMAWKSMEETERLKRMLHVQKTFEMTENEKKMKGLIGEIEGFAHDINK